ncbi:hypothetical protein BKA70DRAFT_1224916 [Coprinopsis sp. MPI-PUGE-AT-0042]|nr:hypothetical protein BKA70DRAFT_1224916 [Coprinopsis sp. MPI-PUGE-AT-0042]
MVFLEEKLVFGARDLGITKRVRILVVTSVLTASQPRYVREGLVTLTLISGGYDHRRPFAVQGAMVNWQTYRHPVIRRLFFYPIAGQVFLVATQSGYVHFGLNGQAQNFALCLEPHFKFRIRFRYRRRNSRFVKIRCGSEACYTQATLATENLGVEATLTQIGYLGRSRIKIPIKLPFGQAGQIVERSRGKSTTGNTVLLVL